MIFGVCAYALMAGYLFLRWSKRDGIARPEVRPDATQADGAGEVGFVPAASMWRAGIGLGGVFIAIAMISGTWYWLIAAILTFGGDRRLGRRGRSPRGVAQGRSG